MGKTGYKIKFLYNKYKESFCPYFSINRIFQRNILELLEKRLSKSKIFFDKTFIEFDNIFIQKC